MGIREPRDSHVVQVDVGRSMIIIDVKEPAMRLSANAYYDVLCEWQDWAEGFGLQHLKGGSERNSLEPGQWMVQSYNFVGGQRKSMNYRRVCFHDSDRVAAIMFKLEWI